MLKNLVFLFAMLANSPVFGAENVGGSSTGLNNLLVSCWNVTTGLRVDFTVPRGDWDCEAAGLVVNPGDFIRSGVVATADGTGSITGFVSGYDAASVTCQNLDTGQKITLHPANHVSWNCTASGLIANLGDQIMTGARGGSF